VATGLQNVSFEHGYIWATGSIWEGRLVSEHFSMECATGGFRALRSHVKAAKESSPASSDRVRGRVSSFASAGLLMVSVSRAIGPSRHEGCKSKSSRN
jgi:hypothetical protein